MKIILKALFAAAIATTATGCSDFLDVNENVNSPLTVTADGILATALNTTAANYSVSYNSYSNWVAGYWAKSGTVNGYAEERTYNYSSLYNQGLFNATYDNLEDYQLIQNQGTSGYPYHAAIARIMKVYNFQLLVDQYGDIPYTDALKGLSNLTPKYDKQEDIYKDFIVQLDGAIADIKAAQANPNLRAVGAEDIVFGGGAAGMVNWIRFANSLKLRTLMRQSQVPALDAYVRTEMTRLQTTATDGYLTTDAEAQPGYIVSAGKQNPFFDRYGRTSAGLLATETRYQTATTFILGRYTANKDPRVFKIYTPVGTGFVGVVLGDQGAIPLGQNTSLLRVNAGGGVLKGATAPTVLMLLSEVLFLRSEAETRGLFTGGNTAAKTNYINGITASFAYFYRPSPAQRGTTVDSSAFVSAPIYTPTAADATLTPAALATKIRLNSGKVARFLAANTGNVRVDFDAAPSGANGKQELIINQKYVAMNTVASTEAWDDYRRTGYPAIPASVTSISTRADKLPVRLLYPLSEVTTNAANLATIGSINQFTSRIFWDPS